MKISRFGYFWLDTWVMANVIQLATQDLCTRFLNRSNDLCWAGICKAVILAPSHSVSATKPYFI